MKFITSPSNLIIHLDRKEQLAALKAKLTMPRAEITDIRWCDTFEEWRRWEVRLPGSAIPGRILAGSYWTEVGWDFLYIRRPIGVTNTVALNVIVIELDGHEKFTRVIISSSEEDYKHLQRWFGTKKPPAKAVKQKKAVGKKARK